MRSAFVLSRIPATMNHESVPHHTLATWDEKSGIESVSWRWLALFAPEGRLGLLIRLAEAGKILSPQLGRGCGGGGGLGLADDGCNQGAKLGPVLHRPVSKTATY